MLQTFTEAGLQVVAYDKFRPGFSDEEVHFEALLDCDFVFISVPTLTSEGGTQDISPLEEALGRLSALKYGGIVVNKCTVLPGVNRTLQRHFEFLKLVHYPEFLRAAHAYDDFKFQKAALLSGPPTYVVKTIEFLRSIFPRLPIQVFKDYAFTEIAKYTHNCFLPVKISFLNEIKQACDIYGVNYLEMINGVVLMDKIGPSHVMIPGPDGLLGWGGACFPKDTKAFLHSMSAQGIEMNTLSGAVKTNTKLRGDK